MTTKQSKQMIYFSNSFRWANLALNSIGKSAFRLSFLLSL